MELPGDASHDRGIGVDVVLGHQLLELRYAPLDMLLVIDGRRPHPSACTDGVEKHLSADSAADHFIGAFDLVCLPKRERLADFPLLLRSQRVPLIFLGEALIVIRIAGHVVLLREQELLHELVVAFGHAGLLPDQGPPGIKIRPVPA